MNRPGFISAILAAGLISGCQTSGPIVKGPQAAEGFKAFSSARSFDPPGRIFRVQANGEVYGVTTLALTPHQGEEEWPKMERKLSISMKEILETIGAATDQLPASANSEVSKKREVVLESGKGKREFLDDDELDKALPAALKDIEIHPGNKYFVIRETISVDTIKYTTSKSWISTLGLEAQFKNIVKDKTNLDWSSEDKFSMDKRFEKPMRLWYKAERLIITEKLGVGPGQTPKVTRVPEKETTGIIVPEPITIKP